MQGACEAARVMPLPASNRGRLIPGQPPRASMVAPSNSTFAVERRDVTEVEDHAGRRRSFVINCHEGPVHRISWPGPGVQLSWKFAGYGYQTARYPFTSMSTSTSITCG